MAIVELLTKYVVIVKRKASGGSQKGGYIVYESTNPTRALEAFSVVSNLYRSGIINNGAYNLEMYKQVVSKETPYLIKSSTLLCKLRGRFTVYLSEEVRPSETQ